MFTLPPGAEIDASVQRYREALAEPQDVHESADPDGRWLYHILVGPTLDRLKKDAKVVIIPDGNLNSLNFETLLVSRAVVSEAKAPAVQLPEANGRLLDRRRHHCEGQFAADLGWHARGKAQTGTAACFSWVIALPQTTDIPNSRKPRPRWKAWPDNSRPRSRSAFSRENATPIAYLTSNPERFSYIHFVAHGTASRLNPLDSAIVLSKAGGEDDSFKLYARDIIRHPLRADLVTISACYSAGERSYSGEGLVGLSWAFLRAGAHNVIAALWDASDDSTELLMDKFYEELNKGASPDAALHAAKLFLLRKSGFRSPFYWAPFELYERLD